MGMPTPWRAALGGEFVAEGGEIAFWADDEGGGGGAGVGVENFTQGPGTGGEGGDELEAGGGGWVGDPAIEGKRIGNGGELVLAALFAGFKGGAAPFFGFSLAGLDDGVAGDEGLDGGDAELDGFLDDEVHVFAFGDGLGKGDGGPGGGRGVGFADLEGDVVARGGEDLGLGPAAVAIEDGDGLAGADAEDLGEVAGFVSGECAALPLGRREVEAGHGELGSFQGSVFRKDPGGWCLFLNAEAGPSQNV